ncbi:hypothetical protein ACFL1H_03905, partial [Nanoarchaeota archaeon]
NYIIKRGENMFKLTKKNKAALNLSMNAIVTLVLSMAMLGVGFIVVNMVTKTVEGFDFDKIERVDDAQRATGKKITSFSAILILSGIQNSISGISGDTTGFKFKFYYQNTSSIDALDGDKLYKNIFCVDNVGALDEDMLVLSNEQIFLAFTPGSTEGKPVEVRIDVSKGEYECSLVITSAATATATNILARKEFTLYVTK